jgi:hypothetical protein
MKKIFILLLFINFSNFLFAQETFKLYGKVTDFNSNPIDSAAVILKDRNFKDIYKTITDKKGNYLMQVAEGTYYCLYAIKPNEYGKTKLEYWAWNIPVYKDLKINPQYDKMEIYGINAFEPRVSPYDTYFVYFRPMSLTKFLMLTNYKSKKEFEKKAVELHDTINIAPKSISNNELLIKINKIEVKILSIQKVVEYARGSYLYGYLVQILKPKKDKKVTDKYDKITIILHSKETGEYGKGELFIEKNK